ncbi:hypothetical protein COV11_02425 [Candidatus Woesearchaeota archaeon CG10_big_fil_rev_8_21_14_0_10_30_7]|nr:MAG: hypothetical protein COV11_02425 [Candidatus Woesearchaeota archaeon CG10_big_fil_rev_8_21_14_0_10_30_7]
MIEENLLDKVRKSLSHPDIVLFRARERNAYTDNAGDYGYRFEIVPKKGFNRIDAETYGSLIALRNKVFKKLLSEEYKLRRIEFEGISYVDWGVIPPFNLAHWNKDMLAVSGLRVKEPIGVREERTEAYCTHSQFHILQKFTSEFSDEENEGENHISYKAFVKRKPITRIIDVCLFPSFDYLKHLSEIYRERDAICSLNLGLDSNSGKDYDRIKEMKRQLGFVDIDSIYIPAYNSFFSDKIIGDSAKA